MFVTYDRRAVRRAGGSAGLERGRVAVIALRRRPGGPRPGWTRGRRGELCGGRAST